MVMRISGLASGMDTDSIVKKLMDVQRLPLTKVKQQKQQLEWKRDDYRALNAKLLDFRNASFSMKLDANYFANKVSSSNENAGTAVANATAVEGTYRIRINKLATTAAITSGDLPGAPGGAKTMSSMGLGNSGTLLTVGGDKGTAVVQIKSTDKLTDVVAAINGKSTSTGVTVSYDAMADRLFFVTSKPGTAMTLRMQSTDETAATPLNLLSSVFNVQAAAKKDAAQILTGTAVFSSSAAAIDSTLTTTEKFKIAVDGGTPKEYAITKDTTLAQLIDSVNMDLGKQGISAYMDSAGKLALFNPQSNALVFSDSNSGALRTKLGFDTPTPTNAVDYSEAVVTGSQADVLFNGVSVPVEGNTFTIAGITITAKQEGTGDIIMGVSQDVDKVFNNIKSYVDKYNELIDTLNKKISEKKYKDYLPLTDVQRKDMKEEEIKLWEEKAKSGMLASDSVMSGGIANFRTAMVESVTGMAADQVDNLADIGISSTIVIGGVVSGHYLEKGKLYIDEAKLRQAITDKPNEIKALFSADDKDDKSAAGDGIAVRLYNNTTKLMDNITKSAGSLTMDEANYAIGKQVKRMNSTVDAMTLRLSKVEERYYKQFSAMESYISRMNSQSSWLSQQFNTGGK